ncbi:DUF222 domain-containing protein [uncultured Amnibacterium sp.]|uniref:HNH endonuclease signature motif containing protein n=1 Tax=uncultured Amnibacterium sp. TaxID=1631851 RepID=UPI0035CC11B7
MHTAAAATREALDGAFAAVLAAPVLPRTATDGEVLAAVEGWEAIGRVVDARRVRAAAEVEWRSRVQLSPNGLAEQYDARDGADLVSTVARIGTKEAKRRIGVGTALMPRLGLTGDELPGRYPVMTAAVNAGEVGVEAARLVVETLNSVRKRTTIDNLEIAEAQLAEAAGILTPDLLHVQTATWAEYLDPDGTEPADEARRQKRAFRLGRLGVDGLTSFTGRATPEVAALLREALQAHRRGVRMTYQPPGGEDAEDLESTWRETDGDQRTTTQYDFDTFAAIITAGVQAEHDGTVGTKAVHEVVVHVTATDLDERSGGGWPEGILTRLPVPTVERIACDGRTRLLITGEQGEALYLGLSNRLFTPAQKKALAARDGGCAWPGCTAPVAWTDAHHIAWWHRDQGPTDIDNGVLLCSHHHHLIHNTDRHEIRLHAKRPHLVPKGWRGPPLPRHRMQRHPIDHVRGGPPKRM